ncbi:MAG: hypothetical protein HY331_18510 [Chloroflexi bacterium]|nr:hypothetical protein [Chloroflexota bacterium]
MTLLLLAIAVAVVLWLIFRRTGVPAVPDTGRVIPEVKRVGGGWVSRLRGRRDGSDLAEQFQRWAADGAMSTGAKLAKTLPAEIRQYAGWLEGLSAEDRAAVVGQVSAFCRSVQFELSWLADPKVSSELKLALEEVVLLHSLAIWSAREMAAFVAFKRWQDAPEDRRNREFERDLYGKVVAAGLAESRPDLVLASEKERRAHVRQAIAAAAERPEAFGDVLRSLAREPGAAGKSDAGRVEESVKGAASSPVEAPSKAAAPAPVETPAKAAAPTARAATA